MLSPVAALVPCSSMGGSRWLKRTCGACWKLRRPSLNSCNSSDMFRHSPSQTSARDVDAHLHEDLADDDVISVFEHRAEDDRHAVLLCAHVSTTNNALVQNLMNICLKFYLWAFLTEFRRRGSEWLLADVQTRLAVGTGSTSQRRTRSSCAWAVPPSVPLVCSPWERSPNRAATIHCTLKPIKLFSFESKTEGINKQTIFSGCQKRTVFSLNQLIYIVLL